MPDHRGRDTDLPDIDAKLRDRAEQLVTYLRGEEPSRRNGNEIRYGRKGGLAVMVSGPDKGRITDHGSGEGKGMSPLRFIAAERGISFGAALDWAREWLDGAAPAPLPPRPKAARAPTTTDADKARKVVAIVKAAGDPAGTPAATYLASRGITGQLPASVRWHPRTWARGGALALLVTDAGGTERAVQLVNLTDAGAKAPVDVVKRSVGPVSSGAVRLPGTLPLVLAEGPETALSVWMATGRETWAALGGVGKLASQVPAGSVVVLARDADPEGSAADKGLARAVDALRARGCEVHIACPPTYPDLRKSDWNDVLVRQGAGAVRAGIEAAADAKPAPAMPPIRGAMVGVDPHWKVSPVPVADARALLPQLLRDAVRDALRIAIKVTPGTGKTHAYHQVAAELDGYTLVLTPNHKLSAEAAKWNAFVVYGIEHTDEGGPMCRYAADAKEVQAAGASLRETLCSVCPAAAECRYRGQFEPIKAAGRGVIVAHNNFLFMHLPGDAPPISRVIIDEAVEFGGMTDFPLDRLAVEMSDPILGAALDRAFGDDGRLALAGFDADELAARAMVERRHAPLEFPPDMPFDERRERIRDHAKRMRADSRWKFARMLDAMADEIRQGREHSGRVLLDRNATGADDEPRHRVRVHYRKRMNEKLSGLPIAYMDGTMDPDHARALLGDDARYASLDVARTLRVTQVSDAAFSKRRMLYGPKAAANRAEVYRFIEALARAHGRVLVGMAKAVRDAIEAEWTPPGNVALVHYNNLRGLNAYEGFDCVVALGREQPSATVLEALARARFPEHEVAALPPGGMMDAEARGYRMRDGSPYGAKVPVHPDPKAQAVLEQIREGEIVQLVDRLRGVNRADPPAVFILCNVPTEIEVDHLVPWRDLLADMAPAEAPWWARALAMGNGIAILKPDALVDAGLFKSPDAAKRAIRALPVNWGDHVYKASAPAAPADPAVNWGDHVYRISIGLIAPIDATFRPVGRAGRHATRALIDAAIPDPRAALEALVGPLASFEILAAPPPIAAPAPAPAAPAPEPTVAPPAPDPVPDVALARILEVGPDQLPAVVVTMTDAVPWPEVDPQPVPRTATMGLSVHIVRAAPVHDDAPSFMGCFDDAPDAGLVDGDWEEATRRWLSSAAAGPEIGHSPAAARQMARGGALLLQAG